MNVFFVGHAEFQGYRVGGLVFCDIILLISEMIIRKMYRSPGFQIVETRCLAPLIVIIGYYSKLKNILSLVYYDQCSNYPGNPACQGK